LRDAEYLRGLCLRSFHVADFDAQLTHQLRAHGEDGGFFRREAKVEKYVAAGFGDFEFLFFILNNLS
jgi:hypothetical protein